MESLTYLIGHWEGKMVAHTTGDTLAVKKDVTLLNDTTIQISTKVNGPHGGAAQISEIISFNKGSNQYDVTVHGNEGQVNTSTLEITDGHSIEFTLGPSKSVIKVQNDQWTQVIERTDGSMKVIEAHLERKK